MRKLTARQEKFIDNVIAGMSHSEAYRKAGYNADKMKPATVAREANKLLKNPNIAPTVEKRKKKLAEKAIWTKEQALKMLMEIATDAKAHSVRDIDGEVTLFNSNAANAAVKAIEQANKMCGYNEPEKHEVDATISIELGSAEEYAE